MTVGTETRRNQRFRCLAAAYAVAALALAAVLVTRFPWPAPVALAVFALLVVWAENGGVRLGSSTGVSASFMVVMAAIAAFGTEGGVLGGAIVGAAGGLVFDLVRERRVAALVINCSQYLLAGVAAGAAYHAVHGWSLVAAAVAAGAAFGAVNAGLILPAVVIRSAAPARHVWASMRPAMPNYLAFGVLGTFVGQLYSSLGWVSVALLLTPVIIARATFSSFLELVQAREATIRVFLRAIEAKDTYTARHTERVSTYSVYIGEELGFSPARIDQLRQAALMHDIGKLAVPKHLLNKPGRLTDDEFVKVQRHAHVCIDILDVVDFLKPMTAAAAGHHARYDGGGYGGTGERPIEAYIVAVADAYDAMTSTRSYRRALPQDVAFAELRANSGSQFHPDCVDALISGIERRGERHGLGYEADAVEFEVAPPVAGIGSAGLGDRLPSTADGDHR